MENKEGTVTIRECLYDRGDHYDSIFKEVDDRDPKKVLDFGNELGFRFFDRVTDSEGKTEEVNFSSWIWYGEKYTHDELAKMEGPIYEEVLRFMEKYNLPVICIGRKGNFTPLDNNNKFYGDVIEQKTK